MNATLKTFAKQTIKDGLAQCTEEQRTFFKRMYSHDNPEKPIDAAVDSIPDANLDWAMEQVRRTLVKNTETQS